MLCYNQGDHFQHVYLLLMLGFVVGVKELYYFQDLLGTYEVLVSLVDLLEQVIRGG